DIGEHAKAEAAFRQALVVQRNVLGKNHPALADTLFGLAQVLDDEHKPGESETFYRESLEIWRKVYGNEHWTIAACLNNITGQLAKGLGPDITRTRQACGGRGITPRRVGDFPKNSGRRTSRRRLHARWSG